MDAPAISTQGLTKHYGEVVALEGLDLDVQRGEVFGFLGPNGAGKSTTIRLLLGLARPTAGTAQVMGIPVSDVERAHRHLGYCPGDVALWPQMTGAEVLVLHVAAPGAPPPTEPGTFTVPRYVDQPQHEWPAWAAEFIARMSALGHPPSEVRFTLSVATGDPGAEIVRAARERDADLVVIAWHGVWEPKRALTMRRVIREVGCPILVVQTGDRGTPAA